VDKIVRNSDIKIADLELLTQRLWHWHSIFPMLIHVAFQIISVFDEIFNKFAAAKARKLCL